MLKEKPWFYFPTFHQKFTKNNLNQRKINLKIFRTNNFLLLHNRLTWVQLRQLASLVKIFVTTPNSSYVIVKYVLVSFRSCSMLLIPGSIISSKVSCREIKSIQIDCDRGLVGLHPIFF